MVENLSIYIGMAIAGVFTGLGSALGQYFATRHIIENISKVRNRFNKKDSSIQLNLKQEV